MAVDPRNGRRTELVAAPALLVVELPNRDAYEPRALEAWDQYWGDPVAATQTPADLMMVYSWIDAYNDYLKHKSNADRRPLVRGSMGQQVANPLYQVAQTSLNLAMACARQLGIGARNRADLGIALLGEKKALDDINARYGGDQGQEDEDDDPRLG